MVPRKCVIYNVNHHGSLVNIICLRYLLNRGDNVILVLAESNCDHYSQEMLREGIFDKVITFRLSIGAQREGDDLIKVLNNYFDDILLKNGVTLNNIAEVYTEADVINPFGIYVALRKKKVTIIEEGINRFSVMNKYDEFFNSKVISKSYRDLQKSLGIMCGETDKYDLILYDGTDETRYFGFTHKYQSINYNECYKYLTASEKSSILKSYSVDVERYRNVDTMLFLNSDGYTESALDVKIPISDVYTTLADYCCKDGEHIVIKLHPYSLKINKKDFLGDEFINNYPIEVINLIDNVKIKRTISANTSAVKKIKGIIDNDITLGASFFRTFSLIHKIYVSMSITDFFVSRSGYKVYQNITSDCNYMNNLLEIISPELHFKNVEYINQNDYCEPSVSIIFDAKILPSDFRTRKDQVIISFNPLPDYNPNYRTEIALNDLSNGTNVITDFLYIFTSDDLHIDNLANLLSMKKTLPRRGLKLEVSTQRTMG